MTDDKTYAQAARDEAVEFVRENIAASLSALAAMRMHAEQPLAPDTGLGAQAHALLAIAGQLGRIADVLESIEVVSEPVDEDVAAALCEWCGEPARGAALDAGQRMLRLSCGRAGCGERFRADGSQRTEP